MHFLAAPFRCMATPYLCFPAIFIKRIILCDFLFSFLDIEDIYFFEMNTKYISSNVMKISVNSRLRSTSEFYDIFNT